MSLNKSVSSSVVASRWFPRPLLTAVLASLLLAGSAVAQTRAPQSAPRPVVTSAVKGAAVTVSYKQRTNYDFEEEVVDGNTVRPDTELVEGRYRPKQDSLIRLRTTFQPEMIKSVESL